MRLINKKGSVLITLIIAMVLMAILGLGIYTMTTSSAFSELLSNRNDNAYQLAKAGIRYAVDTSGTVLGDFLMPDNSNKFNLVINGNEITSTGIVNAGTFLEARRVIKYNLKYALTAPAHSHNVLVTTFNDLTALDLSNSGGIVNVAAYIATGGFHAYWAGFTGASGYYIEDPENSSCTIGYIVTPISNVSPTYYRDALKVSRDKYGQLAYDVQVKNGWERIMNQRTGALEYAASGISFRWHKSLAFPTKYEGYGLTFMRYNLTSGCSGGYTGGDGIPNGIKPSAALANKSLLVLWRQKVNNSGVEEKVWLAYAVLGDPDDRPNSQDPKVVGNQDGVDGIPISDDSTLIIRIEDTTVAAQRVNKIKLFYGDASPYYSGVIRTADTIATNIERVRYSPQWIDNALFPHWPSNYFDPSTGTIANWHPDAHTYAWYDYFTLVSNVPTSPNNNVSLVVNSALVKTPLSSGLCNTSSGEFMCLINDKATIQTHEFILDTYTANREEVGLHVMGNLHGSSVGFDDFVIQILGVNE